MGRKASLILVGCAALFALALGDMTARAGKPAAASESASTFVPLARDEVGGITAPSVGPGPGAHGSTLLADKYGLLVVERTAGALVRVDAEGAPRASIELHEGAGEIVGDGRGAVFVADRGGDRILRVSPGDGEGRGLAIVGELSLPEPHGLALTPDGATLLVTSVADHQLIAVDVATLQPRWRAELAPEPRAVAVASDGRHAAVGFLSSGAVALVDLASAGADIRWIALDPRDHVDVSRDEEGGFDDDDGPLIAEVREAPSRFQVPTSTGRRYARNVFGLIFAGGDVLFAPHEVATPQLVRIPGRAQSDSYGGVEAIPPLVHRLAVIGQPTAPAGAYAVGEQIPVHQPRALAYDLAGDTLYIAGYGDDRVIAVADASRRSRRLAWVSTVNRGGESCGIDGLAVEGGRLWAHCELGRKLVRADLDALGRSSERVGARAWTRGVELAASRRSPLVERGAEIFRRSGDRRLSDGGVLACSSCHPEGRSDGLNWRLGPSVLQTPMLAGRVIGTAPFKWDGQDKNLAASLQHTIERLGGSPGSLARKDLVALQAFLESLPPPRPRSVADRAAVTRGQALFASADLACDACHLGDTLSDGVQHPLKGTLSTSDTPSLIGLGHSAPYYHDGSARDLGALVADKGSVHDMADLSKLSPEQRADLVAYLETL